MKKKIRKKKQNKKNQTEHGILSYEEVRLKKNNNTVKTYYFMCSYLTICAAQK